MSKWLSCAITSLMLVLALAACGGGDDDDDPTATSTTGAADAATATATSTRATGGSDAEASPSASPTIAAAEATPTARGTAPSRPIATEVPTEPAATATQSDAQGVSEIEAEMMEALLQPEDLSGDWTQDTFGLMEPDTDDEDELCGQPPFPDRDQRISGVEAEYTLNAEEPAFLVHNIVLFPEETAVEAIAYAREISSCGEWTDEEGQTFTIQPLDAPAYGDESYTASMSFEIDGTPFYGEYTFIRVGGAIATFAFIAIEGADVSAHQAMVDVVEQRLTDADLGSESASVELSDMLLLPADVALVDSVNAWEMDEEIDPTDEERFSVCDAGSFPDALGSVGESGHVLTANEENGPFLMHSVVQMIAGDGLTAMEWIRSELSCASWSDEDGDYEVTETGDLDVGDDTYWLIVTATTPNDSSQSFQIGFGFSQIGDYISVVGLAAEGSIDPELFGGIIALGAEKVFAGTP